MPQMAPLNWAFISPLFITMLFMVILSSYFMHQPTINLPHKQLFSLNNWMW